MLVGVNVLDVSDHDRNVLIIRLSPSRSKGNQVNIPEPDRWIEAIISCAESRRGEPGCLGTRAARTGELRAVTVSRKRRRKRTLGWLS